ncbi:D-inositol 3-phosphate glycosyltransferase [Methylacidimicrobium cyclopophantes]|uniref:D-inositol 3-phosphate glycosyltransferase n=1 Tax=Methylacidimicrobium cyclopophantes TaxID=1041766 RepID=A0A5E6MM89_9BACT|nr:glycosyltransferase family 4 protein [Methylacidimicrobium cyclopophantes]VVM06534.1 D-inositol 3-phosphate glycosyltransferase [Methylacidimicrobium cyclopophantes]
MKAFSVNIAVSGRFHYQNYVSRLWEEGILQRFYYSHRFDRRILPPEADAEVNLWGKECLARLHGKLFGNRAAAMIPRYNALWETGVLRRWERADLWHVLLHGAAKRILTRARVEGSCTIGEPVNAHPRDIERLFKEEEDRLGLPKRTYFREEWQNIVEEVEKSDFLLVASHWLRRSFASHGYPEERIQILPYGVDLAKFFPQWNGEGDDVFRVLCVGQICPRKGQADLLEAWRRLRLPRAELLLLGVIDEAMRPLLRRFGGLFRYLGYCSFDEVASFYRQASVFVLPSIEDGFADVCGEAMASGLPVIVTENTGAADIVENGVDGFVVPIRSPERIAETLETLYRNPELRRLMAENALRKAEGLSWNSYAQRLSVLYGNLFATRSALTVERNT